MNINNWFTIERVHPRVFAIAEFHHFEKVVSYLLLAGNKAALFDTGLGYANIKLAVSQITHLPVQVFLTHSHWDHIGGAALFNPVAIYDHPFERKLLSQGFKSNAINELKIKSFFQKTFKPRAYTVEGVRGSLALSDGQKVEVGDYRIQVIHTPGHTPGSACYLVKELNVLFSGDTLYPGPLYAHLPGSNLKDFAKSIKKLKKATKETTLFCPGHNTTKATRGLLLKVDEGFDFTLSHLGRSEYRFDRFSIITKA